MGGSVSRHNKKRICDVEAEASEEQKRPNSLYDCIVRNDLAQCVIAVQSGVDLNEELKFSYGRADGKRTFCKYIRTTSLHLACIHRRDSIVETLLEYGANPALADYMGRQPVSLVLLYWPRIGYCGDNEGFSKRENDYKTYIKQQHEKSERCLTALIDHGVNPDDVCTKQDGQSPLHLCAKYNLSSPIQLLVQRGAKVNQRDATYRTPLIMAAKFGNVAAVEKLLKYGADVNAQDETGCSAAHYVSATETSTPCKLLCWLVDYGADVNLIDFEGNTPLHNAAQFGRENCIDVLLNNGGDPDIRNVKGEMPISVLLSHKDNSRCIYAFRRLLSESKQPSILDGQGNITAHVDAPLFAPHIDDLLFASTNPSSLQWLSRQTIRRCMGRQRLNSTHVSSLRCPSFYKDCIILNSDILA